MLFPLWAKLGLFFGGLIGTFLAVYGWINFQHDLSIEEQRRERRLLGLAHAIADAPGVGDLVEQFRTQEASEREDFKALRDWIYRSKKVMGVSWAGITTKDDEDRFSYVIDSSPTARLPVGYPIFDGNEQKMAAWQGHDTFDPELEDDFGLWVLAYVPIKNSEGKVVGLMEAADDANAKELFARDQAERLFWKLALGVLLSLLLAIGFAVYVNRYLRRLTASARRVAAGDLTMRVDIPTRDEIGVLGNSFNGMIAGLKEREFIRDTFGRFVSQEVVNEVLQSTTIRLGGEEREVTVLMSDLRGFTSLSIALGPEELVQLLNRYFTAMSEVIIEHGGTISELLGDGMVVLFGAPRHAPDDALRGVACAVSMQIALMDFNRLENRDLEMGIGLNTGAVVAGNIGSPQRMKYGVVGPTINAAARIESFTVGGQVLISETTALKAGEAQLSLGEVRRFKAKGRKAPLVCYPVRGVRGRFGVTIPERLELERRDVDRAVRLWPVADKEVAAESIAVRAVGLGLRTMWVRCPNWMPARWSNVLAAVEIDESTWLDGIYAKVVEVDATTHTVELRFTAIQEEAAKTLAQL